MHWFVKGLKLSRLLLVSNVIRRKQLGQKRTRPVLLLPLILLGYPENLRNAAVAVKEALRLQAVSEDVCFYGSELSEV